MNIPLSYRQLYSPAQIDDALKKMGADITQWADKVWRESHTDILAIPVLRGGMFIFTDLVRRISCSVEIAHAQTWAYQIGERAVQTPEVKVNIEMVPAKGRTVLLVDDICDSGRTLKTLKESLLKAGALDVRSAVLIKRVVEPEIFTPEWCGFVYEGKEWFVGYGMEDAERWRNLPGVYIIQKESKK